jgi:hypothetical protein
MRWTSILALVALDIASVPSRTFAASPLELTWNAPGGLVHVPLRVLCLRGGRGHHDLAVQRHLAVSPLRSWLRSRRGSRPRSTPRPRGAGRSRLSLTRWRRMAAEMRAVQFEPRASVAPTRRARRLSRALIVGSGGGYGAICTTLFIVATHLSARLQWRS